MSRKFLTSQASRFLGEHGRPCSARTLQKYRTKAPGDPGEKGPKFFRDPVTASAIYFEEDLLAWVAERDLRLIERGAVPQPAQLSAA